MKNSYQQNDPARIGVAGNQFNVTDNAATTNKLIGSSLART